MITTRHPRLRRYISSYDPRLHITAGQLRRLGFYVAENLDDEAYIPRVAIGLRRGDMIRGESATLGLTVLTPFSSPEVDFVAA